MAKFVIYPRGRYAARVLLTAHASDLQTLRALGGARLRKLGVTVNDDDVQVLTAPPPRGRARVAPGPATSV